MNKKTMPDLTGRILESDLEYLRFCAKEAGADDAVILETSDVLLDPRVRFKCMVPKCYMSGGCGHCPPNGYSLDQVRQILARHERAVFFRVRVKSSIIAAKDLSLAINSGVMDDSGNLLNLGAHYMLVYSIVALLKKRARQIGYGSYAGFAAGNCRDALCHFQPVCQEIATGQCRHPDLSSPSMESCGMDAFTMAARAGWDVYPIGGTCEPGSVPLGNLMGLVLVTGSPDTEGEATARAPEKPSSHRLSFSQRRERLKKDIKRLSENLRAMKEGNVDWKQMSKTLPEQKKWTQLAKNLHELDESWIKVVRRNLRMFSGRPKKKASI